jgi:hypothetical protein
MGCLVHYWERLSPDLSGIHKERLDILLGIDALFRDVVRQFTLRRDQRENIKPPTLPTDKDLRSDANDTDLSRPLLKQQPARHILNEASAVLLRVAMFAHFLLGLLSWPHQSGEGLGSSLHGARLDTSGTQSDTRSCDEYQ